jgi:hypothetical protein
MNNVAVVIPYFGKFKPSFALWYESAKRNSDVDFFIFSDDTPFDNPADNIKWIPFTLQDFNALAVAKLGINFRITHPYKLCDFKPMYGVIFEDYLRGYEYWAYGDVDLIYGKGISREGEVLDMASDLNIIEKGGAWFSYNGERLGQGRENVKELLRQKPELKKEIEIKIRQQLFN